MPSWRRLGLLLLAAHLALAAARVPGVVFARRWNDVDAFRRRGAAHFFLDRPERQGADAIAWLRQHTPPDAVVPFRGSTAGAVEFAPALLWPRLLYAEAAIPPGAGRMLGRPLAAGPIDGAGSGTVVLEADPEIAGSVQHLRLRRR